MNGCTHCRHYQIKSGEHPKYGEATLPQCGAGHTPDLIKWLEDSQELSYVEAPEMLCYEPNMFVRAFDRMESNINTLLTIIKYTELNEYYSQRAIQ